MKIASRLYQLFLIGAICFFVISFFTSSQTIDIHIHDTYFVIGVFHFYIFIAFVLLFFWLLYLLLKNFLFSNLLTWIHIIAILISISLFAILMYKMPHQQRAYFDINLWTSFNTISKAANSAILIFVSSQLSFVINIIGGLLKKFMLK